MNNVFKTTLLLCATLFVFAACRKKAFDEYYGRPESLEPPIYQTLQAKGRFSTLLAAIDRSGYKNTLSAAGYWSFFAPNDSAFRVYFQENNIGSIDQLDSAACQRIVTYCLVYNAFNKDRIDDFQSNTGWQANTAFRRRTAFYTGIYRDTNTQNQSVWAIASNRNNNAAGLNYVEADQNNKFIPIFTDTFFNSKVLTAADYNYFYPNTPFTGFNVAGAQVLEKNIPAENGVIHEINRVITALPSIDQYLGTRPEYSDFRKLFNRYLVEYVLNQSVTQRYNNQGNAGQVYTKVFNSALAFSPNNENFLKLQDNDGQTNGYTLFAPTNAVLQNYIQTVLLENYPPGSTLDAVPRQTVYDFINAHMWQSVVWPSKFSSTLNFLNEEARFNPGTDIVEKRMLSNGAFYGTSKVQEANVFTTVYGRAYLDPRYSLMQQLMNAEIRTIITNPGQRYTIFMMSDSAIRRAGYVQDPLLSADVNLQWRFTPPAGSTATAATGAAAYNRLIRMLNMHVVATPNNELDNLAGSGVAQTYGGEFIKWNGDRVQAAGNLEDGVAANNWVNITGSKTSKNGKVYYCDKLLTFSESTIGKHIEKIGTPTGSTYSYFWQYLRNATASGFYNTTTGEIAGVSSGNFYTVFIPDTVSIVRAVNEGFLPGTGTAPNRRPNFAPTTVAEQQQVVNFIQYHILNKISVGTDGLTSGSIETLFVKPSTGAPGTVFVTNFTNRLELKDMLTLSGIRAQTILANSNYLSNRCLIHSINNYLRYTP